MGSVQIISSSICPYESTCFYAKGEVIPMQKSKYAVLLVPALIACSTSAALAQKKTTKPTKQAVGTIGTRQMAGTEGQLGVAYSLKDKDFVPRFNITLTSVTYSTKRFSFEDTTASALFREKYLVLRYVVHNPIKEDIEMPAYYMASKLFQAVGSDNKTYEPQDWCYNTFLDLPVLSPGKKYPSGDLKLKPGQKSETVVALIPLPSEITVPKLVVKRGRVGTKEEVLRFDIRDKVKSDFGIFADSANPSVPKEETSAQTGTAYPLTNLEFTVSDLKRESGPLTADVVAEEGKEFITGTIALKNVSPQVRYMWVDSKPIITLVDEDGEKVSFDSEYLKANRTEVIAVGNVEPLDSRKGIFYFQIPKNIKYKQILIHERNFPEFVSRRLVYDISSL